VHQIGIQPPVRGLEEYKVCCEFKVTGADDVRRNSGCKKAFRLRRTNKVGG